MAKQEDKTPRGKIKAALRLLWMRSRERSTALKRDKYTCQACHRKQSTAKGKEFKVQVHHKEGVANWDKVIDTIYEYLLCHPDLLETLCEECHDQQEGHKGTR